MTANNKAKQTTLALTGNEFVAEAFRQIEPDAVCAYPITPQTTIVEAFAKFVADGVVKTEYVCVESEHSAMSASIGAAAAGGRAFTVTAAQGLALMWEELHIAAGLRLPIVMVNVNRALSAPINIHGDHSDVMGARDSGWIIMFAENAQEAYDNMVIAPRIAETNLLPVMPTLDGFITSHSIARAQVVDDDAVKAFVGEYCPSDSLLFGEGRMIGGFANLGPTYMKVKKTERNAIDKVLPSMKAIGDQWEALTGRAFEHVETFGMEDATGAIVVCGSAAGNARAVARELRDAGEKVGVVKLRTFRPFPLTDVASALANVQSVAVMDRAESFGAQAGPLALEVMGALYTYGLHPALRSYVYGLGGADVKLEYIRQVYQDLKDVATDGTDGFANLSPRYVGIA